MNDLISRLLAHDRIRAARHHIERTDEGTLARQAALSAIPAPTGAEGRRAAHVAELFRTIGLSDVTVDHAGNVHGRLGKNGEKFAPVVLAAHLDTVFGAEVDVAVERRGERLEGPGISDNARGLAALVAVAEAMVAARVPVARPILFAATVGEEGSGDLRGVKYLLNGKHGVGAQHAAPLRRACRSASISPPANPPTLPLRPSPRTESAAPPARGPRPSPPPPRPTRRGRARCPKCPGPRAARRAAPPRRPPRPRIPCRDAPPVRPERTFRRSSPTARGRYRRDRR